MRMEIGRTPQPFKSNDLTLPHNKRHCLKKLLLLKCKILNDQRVQSDYLAIMQKILDRGHVSCVPVDQLLPPGKVLYLLHFNIFHPRKLDQIRVVFDCSALFENESLNKHLLQGSDLPNSLVGVLTHSCLLHCSVLFNTCPGQAKFIHRQAEVMSCD